MNEKFVPHDDDIVAIDREVRPTSVRYIKLGRGGGWEAECVEKGIVRFGFESARPDRFPLCREGRWEELKRSFVSEGKKPGIATNITNQTKIFFEDRGQILWVTFVGDLLRWGRFNSVLPQPHEDGDGVWRPMDGGWRSADLLGETLSMDRLSGKATKYAGFRGTTCEVRAEDASYIVHRINGEKLPQVEAAILSIRQLNEHAVDLLKLLDPRDFETLVDLVFSTSGWRRQGPVGGTAKTIDFDIELPSTGERAFVQTKSETSAAEFNEYITRFEESSYDRMFYVFHSWRGPKIEANDDRLTIVGPARLAELVVEAGLVNWLISKVS